MTAIRQTLPDGRVVTRGTRDIHPELAPNLPAADAPRRSIRVAIGTGVTTLDSREAAARGLAELVPPAQPTLFERAANWFAPRKPRADGSVGTVIEAGPSQQSAVASPIGAVAALKASIAQRELLKAQLAELESKAAPHRQAAPAHRAEVLALDDLERADVDIAAKHSRDSTRDHDVAERAKGIDAANTRVAAAARSVKVAGITLRQYEDEAKRAHADIAAIHSSMPSLIRAAAEERLVEFAPIYARAWQQLLAAETHAFGLVKLIGPQMGDGLTAHLCLPRPEHIAYRGLDLPRNLPGLIEQEAQRIAAELQA